MLKIPRLDYLNNAVVIGDFSSVWQPDHKGLNL